MKEQTKRLCVTAVLLALAAVLSMLPLFTMPFGGCVTPASMLPLCLIALLYGTKWGLFSGTVYGLIQMLLGLSYFSYATSLLAAAAIFFLDYLFAFGVLGFSGLFVGRMKNQTVASLLGVTAACFLRFACHFVSGVTVWRELTGWDAVWYSLSYNGGFMLAETILTLLVLFPLLRIGLVERLKKL